MHTSEHVDIPEYLYKREHKFTLDLHLYKNLIGELSRLISHGQSKTRKKSKEKLKVKIQTLRFLNLIYKLILSSLHVTHFSSNNFCRALKNSFFTTASM